MTFTDSDLSELLAAVQAGELVDDHGKSRSAITRIRAADLTR